MVSLADVEGVREGSYAVDLCPVDRGRGTGDTVNGHRDTAMMSDIFLPLIGIILIAFIMVVWL